MDNSLACTTYQYQYGMGAGNGALSQQYILQDTQCNTYPTLTTHTSSSIRKLEKGFVVTHEGKEYACECLSTVLDTIKRLLTPDKK